RRAVELDLVSRRLVGDAQPLLAVAVVEHQHEPPCLERADLGRIGARQRARRGRDLARPARLAPVTAQVVRVVDVALVEQDAHLGADLRYREEAAAITAPADRAEREGPGARRLDQARDTYPNAAELFGIGAVDYLADVEPVVPQLVALEVV